MASAASVTCNSFLQVSRLHIWLCRVRLCTNKLDPLEAMACVFYTQRQVLTLIHINEADKFQLRLLERLVTTCRSTPR
jgi:hypothetical protein